MSSELLRLTKTVVGVSLIIITISVLFINPILARTGSDPAVECQNNLKSLARAVLIYCNDYDAVLPSSILYNGSTTWNPDDFTSFASKQGYLPPPKGYVQKSWPMLLYSYTRNMNAIWCTEDQGRSNDPDARVSYYWKAAVDAAWFGGPDGTGPICCNEGSFYFPAEQIIFYEHNGWHWGSHGQAPVDGIAINCAFLDGHVSTVIIRDSGYLASENPPGPLPESGTGEPAWFNYSYGNSNPGFSKDRNWDPTIWGDYLN